MASSTITETLKGTLLVHPKKNEIQKLCTGATLPSSIELTDALDELGLLYTLQDGQVLLDEQIELLDQNYLRAQLKSPVDLEIFWTIGSTNDHVMKTGPGDAPFHICLAEQQSSGKGRRGRVWVSPFGVNLYMSTGFLFAGSMSDLEGLSVAIGLRLVADLRALGIESAGIKWPNDVLVNDRKLAGILVELGAPKNGGLHVVVGVGVNVAISDRQAVSIDQPWTAARQHTDAGRNRMAGKLLSGIQETITVFSTEGFAPFMPNWESADLLFGKAIKVMRGEEIIQGTEAGIDEHGNLLLETSSGVRRFNAGEVSVRALAEGQ